MPFYSRRYFPDSPTDRRFVEGLENWLNQYTPSSSTALAEGQGLKGQNFDRVVSGSSSTLTDGTIYAVQLDFRAGDIVNNLYVAIATAASGTPSVSKMGIYDTSGNRLAISADQGTAWSATGTAAVPLTAPYTVTANGSYYVAIISKAGTTPITVLRGSNVAAVNTAVGSGVTFAKTQASQTDLVNPATFVNTGIIGFWTGWS